MRHENEMVMNYDIIRLFSTNCFDVFDSTAVLSRFVGSLIIGVDLDFISASNVVQ